jgi:cell filamentation protein
MFACGLKHAGRVCKTRLLKDYLREFAGLAALKSERLIGYLARTHVEFIVIHPFREGNGRISRLLMDVMATQAGYGPLDYSLWDQHKEFYFKAIQAGYAGDYQHLERLIRDTLEY